MADRQAGCYAQGYFGSAGARRHAGCGEARRPGPEADRRAASHVFPLGCLSNTPGEPGEMRGFPIKELWGG
ncbi:hypothetical protein Sgleb_31310 [Streptomyces glebosus]|uniref:Uncharacterized protein n=1 Tax=Streptomyces glebosus TaxID=249580 RepID=A0A640SW77_9ACTN|nr:hypothetical protein Sgleb_31310 [Streptomyces glebosus]GHG61024.1 hypothetical protein GCM10010513_26810 [Streptomyces glebosus]